MSMNPFPDFSGAQPERIAVAALLTPGQAARLEALIADIRAADPSIDDEDVIDALFETGLAWFEANRKHEAPAA